MTDDQLAYFVYGLAFHWECYILLGDNSIAGIVERSKMFAEMTAPGVAWMRA